MAVIKASQDAYKRILKEAAIDGLGIEQGLDRLLAGLDIEIENLKKKLSQKPKEVKVKVSATAYDPNATYMGKDVIKWLKANGFM